MRPKARRKKVGEMATNRQNSVSDDKDAQAEAMSNAFLCAHSQLIPPRFSVLSHCGSRPGIKVEQMRNDRDAHKEDGAEEQRLGASQFRFSGHSDYSVDGQYYGVVVKLEMNIWKYINMYRRTAEQDRDGGAVPTFFDRCWPCFCSLARVRSGSAPGEYRS